MRQAVIDIGSNNIRLSVYQVEGRSFKTLLTWKETAGLAAYVQTGALSENGIRRAGNALDRLGGILKKLGLSDPAVFATASLRNITNTGEAVARMEEQTGWKIQVLSGREEARLGVLGARQDCPLEDGLAADIGGGSTQVSILRQGEAAAGESFPVGSLRLWQDCVERLYPAPAELECMRQRAADFFGSSAGNWTKGGTLTCIGGTARAARSLAVQSFGLPKGSRSFSRWQLEKLLEKFSRQDRAGARLLVSCCPGRLHTILPGLTLLAGLAEAGESEIITVSRYGVREGYLWDRLGGRAGN